MCCYSPFHWYICTVQKNCTIYHLLFSWRTLPGKLLEEISLNIAKFNIHALVIVGGFEVRLNDLPLSLNDKSTSNIKAWPRCCLRSCRPMWEVWSWFKPGRSTRRCASPLWLSLPPSPTTSPVLTSASAPTLPSTPSLLSVFKQQIHTWKQCIQQNSDEHTFCMFLCRPVTESSSLLQGPSAVCSLWRLWADTAATWLPWLV